MSRVRALLLAAGMGTRLNHLTKHCPKCLMPISGRPILEHWLCSLQKFSIEQVIVNIHHHQQLVEAFLARPYFSGWVHGVVEEKLLGTAGTLRENSSKLSNSTTLLVHADNWCQCDLGDFIDFHQHSRPPNSLMTMMVFRTPTPKTCGVVDIDCDGIVQRMYEKEDGDHGNLANGAVYLLEPEVVKWVAQKPWVSDFSTGVLPNFLGRIATWENTGIHRDIGAVASLLEAQNDLEPEPCWPDTDHWMDDYRNNPVHRQLNS